MRNISKIKHRRMNDFLKIISCPRPRVLIYSLTPLYINRLSLWSRIKDTLLLVLDAFIQPSRLALYFWKRFYLHLFNCSFFFSANPSCHLFISLYSKTLMAAVFVFLLGVCCHSAFVGNGLNVIISMLSFCSNYHHNLQDLVKQRHFYFFF